MTTVEEIVRSLVDTGKLKLDDIETEEEDNPITGGECKKRLKDMKSKQNEITTKIFQMLHQLEEKVATLSINVNEGGKKIKASKMEIMNELKNIKMEVIYQVERMKTETDKSRQDVKTRLGRQSTQMNSVQKKGELNGKSLSTLFVQVHNLRAETKEDFKDLRAIQDMKFRDCNRATQTLSTLFHSTLEERFQKEVTSMAEKHKEEISKLTEKMEMLSEELRKNQLSLKNQLENGLEMAKIGNEIDDNIKSMIEDTISDFEINIFDCDFPEETSENGIKPKVFYLEKSIVVLNPLTTTSTNKNSGCPLNLRWTIHGLKATMEQEESFEVLSEKFQFPGFPFAAARAKMRCSDDGYAHFSLHFENEDFEEDSHRSLLQSRLFFMLENQKMSGGKSGSRRMGYVKGTAFNYFLTKERNLIGKSWLTDAAYNVNDAVVVGIGAEPATAAEKENFYDDFYFQMDNYRREKIKL